VVALGGDVECLFHPSAFISTIKSTRI